MWRPATLQHSLPCCTCRAMGLMPCRAVSHRAGLCTPCQPTPLGAPHTADLKPPVHLFLAIPPAPGVSASPLQPWWEGAHTPVFCWGIRKPPNSLGLNRTAISHSGAANPPEMQLPLPPPSDGQWVSASPATLRNNLLLLMTADCHSQLLAKPPAPWLLLAKKLSLHSKAGAESAAPHWMCPLGGG